MGIQHIGQWASGKGDFREFFTAVGGAGGREQEAPLGNTEQRIVVQGDRLDLSAAYMAFTGRVQEGGQESALRLKNIQAQLSGSSSGSGNPLMETGSFSGVADDLKELDPEMLPLFLAVSQMLSGSENGKERLEAFVSGVRRVLDTVKSGDVSAESGSGFRMSMQKVSAALQHTRQNGSSEVSVRMNVEALSIEIESEGFVARIDMVTGESEVRKGDPLVLDLDGDGIELTDIENGVNFDIDADGRPNRTAFVRPDDGILSWDRNGNGIIDNTTELFGDRNGAKHGFEDLAVYDANRDGKIDGTDPVFGKIRVFRDMNLDGISAPHELSRLSDLGIASLDLGYENTSTIVNGNTIAQTGFYTREDNSRRVMGDVLLNYLT